MGPKDETSAKAAEIGDGLIESLGFEPADGKRLGRSAVAEMSDQISEAGFSVTEALEGTADDSSSGATKADTKTETKTESKNGSGASGNGSSSSTPSSSTPSSSSSSKPTASASVATKVEPPDSQDLAGSVPPTSPPIVDFKVGSPGDAPASPAVTGELPRIDARVDPVVDPVVDPTPPAIVEQQPQVVDNRSIVERPRSVSDLFSGGITGRRRLQARKVRRVIRHIDPWSVLTFSVMFHLCLFAALLLASALVFNVAEEAGTIENLESFIRELGDYETFEIDGQAIFKAAVAIAGIMTLAASVLVVLLTVMFNLLSDLLGGVRITVIEEETVRVKPKNSDAE